MREQLEFDWPTSADTSLEAVFEQALRAAVRKQPVPPVEARFYPYAGLSSTIRLRRGRVYARVSDILSHAPPKVLYALASILVAKLYRLKVAKHHEHIYREHTTSQSVLEDSDATRRRRGYKVTTSARGEVYDLGESFDQLNKHYFSNKIARPLLSWSPRKTRRVLGHHDQVHRTIVISRTLDSSRIPRFVLEYVLYHEMLHIKHPRRVVSGRTVYHGRDFREDERRFERFEEALKWLEKIASPARRRARKPRRFQC
ncbi:MAG TPA: SprT-like domain-containing protein [Blastocatellia bacterium]|nr:SprT-like domain-containing protein [Blastocatellia bacterium]